MKTKGRLVEMASGVLEMPRGHSSQPLASGENLNDKYTVILLLSCCPDRS